MSEEKQTGSRSGKYQSGRGAATGGVIAIIVLLVVIAAICVYTAYGVLLQNTVFSGVRMGSVDLSGLDRSEARAALDAAYGQSDIEDTIDIRVGEQSFALSAREAGLSYDIAKSVDAAYRFGRQDSFLIRARQFWSTRLNPVQLPLETTLDSEKLLQQVSAIAKAVDQPLEPSGWNFEEDTLTLDRGQAGLSLDDSKLMETLDARLRKADFSPVEAELTVTRPEALQADDILKAVNKPVEQTTLDLAADPTGKTIRAGVPGVAVDPTALARALSDEKRVSTVTCTVTQPDYTVSDYQALLFRDELSSRSSHFNPRNEGRTTNVLLAADFCNGVILMPGDVFSYNTAVGPRTKERGFRDAIVYVGDKAEDGLGGGICQVSSTIYSAVLRADLKIVERANHSRMVTYVPLGEDATVVWGARDFRFENDTDFPIKLVTSHKTDSLTVRILGTALVNKTVKLETTELSKTPFEIQRVVNPELAPGTEKVKSNGYTGYKTETWRVVYIDGKEVSRTFENKSTYRKYDKVIEYNPAEEEPSLPSPVGPSLPVDPDPVKPADPVVPTEPSVPDPVPDNPGQLTPVQP